jgi:3-phosphoshikimate 1-carboxyvinyltransferase
MSDIQVESIKKFDVELTVPGDKSISHRAAILASFAAGRTRVSNYLASEDCLCTLNIMRALGTHVETADENTFIIEGRAGTYLRAAEDLDCGNSGTSIRLISGLLAGQPFESRLFGDASLSRRPMKRVVEPLTLMGARLVCEGENMRPPVRVIGGPLQGIDYKTPVPSAQVKSCVLLAGLQASGKTSVTEDYPSRDHTERMLRHFHASVQREENKVTVHGGHDLYANDLHVPGDFSSAAFWLVATAACPGARLVVRNVGLNPTRTGLLNILMRMGANISEQIDSPSVEPAGTLQISEGGTLRATEIGGAEIPNVIDELPILSVAAALAEGTTVIRDAAELRVKETDRIAAVARNLRAFGVPVEERPDGLAITGRAPLKGARVESYGDHRIAMAFSVLGLFSAGRTVVENTECIATSYPTFRQHLAQVIESQGMTIKNPFTSFRSFRK